mmetsp:Transcript_42878/g.49289  ORF Transcript_42878/g.49289 Transcript_42878/m.49289 type:complete len:181 (+) Transcript_42878:1290-1832(+)
MVDVTQTEKLTTVFSYGSNHPDQLSTRLKVSKDYLLAKSFPCSLEGYTRAYGRISYTWGGSVATMVPQEGARAFGYACKLNSEELEILNGYEGYPTCYRREKVELKHPNGSVVPGEVYIANNDEEYKDPCPKYLTACQKTEKAYYDLQTGIDNPYASHEEVKITVKRASNLEEVFVYPRP